MVKHERRARTFALTPLRSDQQNNQCSKSINALGNINFDLNGELNSHLHDLSGTSRDETQKGYVITFQSNGFTAVGDNRPRSPLASLNQTAHGRRLASISPPWSGEANGPAILGGPPGWRPAKGVPLGPRETIILNFDARVDGA